ncbi:MAG: hypothetical protein R2710_26605 [Acidimicrobiales bacterium]
MPTTTAACRSTPLAKDSTLDALAAWRRRAAFRHSGSTSVYDIAVARGL